MEENKGENKYEVMFWAGIIGIAAGILFVVSMGFLTTTLNNVVTFAIVVVFVVITITTPVIANTVLTVVLTVVLAAVIAAAGNTPFFIFVVFSLAIIIIGLIAMNRRYKNKENIIAATLLIAFIVVVIVGLVPAFNVAFTRLIPKDQAIARELSESFKETDNSFSFSLPYDEENYLKEFFFLKKKDGSFIPFKEASFQMEASERFTRLPDGTSSEEKNQNLEITFYFESKIESGSIVAFVSRHELAPALEFPLSLK